MNHRKAFGLMLAFAVLTAAALYAFLKLDRIGPAPGHMIVMQISAFTKEGCSFSASAEDALRQLELRFPSLHYRYYNIVTNAEAADKFRVTVHPTVILQNEYGQELARIERHIGEKELIDLLENLKAHPRPPQIN